MYFGLPEVDPWDEPRDARKYQGPHPVVAHPPCSRWCALAHLNQKRYGHKVGDDGGCFESALNSVRTFGGVLEHPKASFAWKRFNLPRPVRGRWIISGGLWVTEVSQGVYGCKARKMTWLLYNGKEPFPLNWNVNSASAQISFWQNYGNARPGLSKKEASKTPLAFRDVLIALARNAR